MEKVVAAIPRPRINQLIYAGVLGPNAKCRKEVVAFGRAVPAGGTTGQPTRLLTTVRATVRTEGATEITPCDAESHIRRLNSWLEYF
jgi:hypothetical protein